MVDGLLCSKCGAVMIKMQQQDNRTMYLCPANDVHERRYVWHSIERVNLDEATKG